MENKDWKIISFLLIAVLVLFLGNMAFSEIQKKQISKEESAEFAEELMSIGLESQEEIQDLEKQEEEKDIALTYINAVIKDAFQKGTDSALKQIISFAQNEDGPLCDNITIGEVILINTACLQVDN